MYKKYNFEPKTLSPLSPTGHRRHLRSWQRTGGLTQVLERLTPLLILAASFIWLWR